MFRRKRREHDHLHSRKKCQIHLEARVLRRRPDQNNRPAPHAARAHLVDSCSTGKNSYPQRELSPPFRVRLFGDGNIARNSFNAVPHRGRVAQTPPRIPAPTEAQASSADTWRPPESATGCLAFRATPRRDSHSKSSPARQLGKALGRIRSARGVPENFSLGFFGLIVSEGCVLSLFPILHSRHSFFLNKSTLPEQHKRTNNQFKKSL